MTLDLAIVDYWASSGQSVCHRFSALAKLILLNAVVLAAVFSTSLPFLVTLYALVWLLVLASRLPLGRVALLALYPAAFSTIFILSRWDGTWSTPLTYLLRALTGGLAAVWLVGTTPYPDLFAPLSRMLPSMVADALFLTYRAFFALAQRLLQLTVALRLRGGLGRGGAMRALGNLGQGLGTVVLFSAERSQRVYAVMALRGHSGRVCGCRHWAQTTRLDWIPLALAAAVALTAVLVGRMAA